MNSGELWDVTVSEILTQFLLPSYHVFSNMHESRMNIGYCLISLLSTSSTLSTVWAQFLAKTDTKDTKTTLSIFQPALLFSSGGAIAMDNYIKRYWQSNGGMFRWIGNAA